MTGSNAYLTSSTSMWQSHRRIALLTHKCWQQLTAVSCRGAKATSLASKVAEQFGGGGSGMSLRHASTAGADRTSEAAEPSAHPPPRIPPRVHRPVVRESDMRKFAGLVFS